MKVLIIVWLLVICISYLSLTNENVADPWTAIGFAILAGITATIAELRLDQLILRIMTKRDSE